VAAFFDYNGISRRRCSQGTDHHERKKVREHWARRLY